MTQVVVTGLGAVTPIGSGTEGLWDGLMSGRSGAGPITQFETESLPVRIACEVTDFDPANYVDARQVGRTDRFTQMAVAATTLAIEDFGEFDFESNGDRVGVIIGSGIGGIGTIEREHSALLKGGPRRVSPFMVPRLMPNAAAAAVAMKFKLFGPNYAPTSACATGAHAIGEAYRNLKAGAADVMIAGGTESALTPLSVSAFARMGALSRRNDDPGAASRPFEKNRDGFVFGEGAGVLILETREHAEKRGAPILAEVAGYGASADAFHVTQPDPEGAGATLAMRAALNDAKANPDEVDYINAHGTSTPYNDRVETIAIKSAFGVEAKRIPVSSTKSQTGHLLGAAGAVEAMVSVLAVARNVIPGTINLDESDPECDLDYVGEGPRETNVRLALSNSFGFGGQNSCLLFRKP
ncbi:MAG TPA: beta-ketoacyl-ACP synthase II [Actinomycetota bacterium]|nr:beta-ketoacyl-ACP synthase II [Actinomycetota bacterium]